jgi:hypothetical protein
MMETEGRETDGNQWSILLGLGAGQPSRVEEISDRFRLLAPQIRDRHVFGRLFSLNKQQKSGCEPHRCESEHPTSTLSRPCRLACARLAQRRSERTPFRSFAWRLAARGLEQALAQRIVRLSYPVGLEKGLRSAAAPSSTWNRSRATRKREAAVPIGTRSNAAISAISSCSISARTSKRRKCSGNCVRISASKARARTSSAWRSGPALSGSARSASVSLGSSRRRRSVIPVEQRRRRPQETSRSRAAPATRTRNGAPRANG